MLRGANARDWSSIGPRARCGAVRGWDLGGLVSFRGTYTGRAGHRSPSQRGLAPATVVWGVGFFGLRPSLEVHLRSGVGACGVAGWQSPTVPERDGSRASRVSVSIPRDSFLRFCRGLISYLLVQSRSAAENPSPWSPRWGPHGVAAAVVQAAGGHCSENHELR